MSALPLSRGGSEDPLLPRLRREIHRATEIDLAVSFIMVSGLELIFGELVEALEERGAAVQILTTDYLSVTEPEALRRLMLLVERGAQVRVYEAGARSFHVKAYLFVRTEGGRILEGSAYIGSSNLSRPALLDGIEWNYRVDAVRGEPPAVRERFHGIRGAFQELWESPATSPLTWPWIEEYEARRPRVLPPPVPGARDPDEPPPEPHEIQREALDALVQTRAQGHRRGLVVMATGLGKTWLAAFDVARFGARRVLFVAHREEILLQAEETFQRILPDRRVGRYDGTRKDEDGELLFASVQTLSREAHLDRFPPDHFDYVIVDEFHHAAAPTYRRLLHHFRPRFLLGLTATPDRTDQSDILSFCDDNLVFERHLFDAVQSGHLVPFAYWGIFDESVDYGEIPWRSGRFDPRALENRLATLARARHVLREWQEKKGERTLAFCTSRLHADFMAEEFRKVGVPAVAVHGASEVDRGAALDALERGEIDVIFSVDLFNEGVDIPPLDTVLMLRPTESRILFLQQLGRGLRRWPGKERLIVLDFLGNHRAFLRGPQALFQIGASYREMARFARNLERDQVELPPGCFVNLDLELLDFLKALDAAGVESDYEGLRDALGRRPGAPELYRSGADLQRLRRDHGHWWNLVREQGDLTEAEARCLERHEAFFQEVETTSMVRSFKMVLLQALIENDGFLDPPHLEDVSAWSLEIFKRRRRLVEDLAKSVRDVDEVTPARWHSYWSRNPINAWTGGNLGPDAKPWFEVESGRLKPAVRVDPEESETFHSMLQELVDFRLARYGERVGGEFAEAVGAAVHLPVFPDVDAATRWRDEGGEPEATRAASEAHGPVSPEEHFFVPDPSGGLYLLQWTEEQDLEELLGEKVVATVASDGGEAEYLFADVREDAGGRVVLRTERPEYEGALSEGEPRIVARVVGKEGS